MNEIIEEWRDIVGYGRLYQVSNMGNVRAWYKTLGFKNVSKFKNEAGYEMVNLHVRKGEHCSRLVHRLVSTVFLDNKFNLPEVNHKDENKSNNKVSNLEWCTREYNLTYGKLKRIDGRKKILPVVQLKDGEVVNIYSSCNDAEKNTKISRRGIWNCCNGQIKQYKGYKWEYVK